MNIVDLVKMVTICLVIVDLDWDKSALSYIKGYIIDHIRSDAT